jgi:hypothetical protein
MASPRLFWVMAGYSRIDKPQRTCCRSACAPRRRRRRSPSLRELCRLHKNSQRQDTQEPAQLAQPPGAQRPNDIRRGDGGRTPTATPGRPGLPVRRRRRAVAASLRWRSGGPPPQGDDGPWALEPAVRAPRSPPRAHGTAGWATRSDNRRHRRTRRPVIRARHASPDGDTGQEFQAAKSGRSRQGRRSTVRGRRRRGFTPWGEPWGTSPLEALGGDPLPPAPS